MSNALVALLREIDTRCVKDDAAVRLVAIDEALIASVKSLMERVMLEAFGYLLIAAPFIAVIAIGVYNGNGKEVVLAFLTTIVIVSTITAGTILIDIGGR